MRRIPLIYICATLPPIVAAVQSTAMSIRPTKNITSIFLIALFFCAFCVTLIGFYSLIAALQKKWRIFVHAAVGCFLSALVTLPALKSGNYFHLAICLPAYMNTINTHPDEAVFRFSWENPADYVSGAAGYGPIEIVYDRSGATEALVGRKRYLPGGDYAITERLFANFYTERTY